MQGAASSARPVSPSMVFHAAYEKAHHEAHERKECSTNSIEETGSV